MLDDVTDFRRTAAVINKVCPDVVAVQEIDSVTGRSGGKDVLREIAGLTLMHHMYAPAIDYDGGKYGIGMLSKEKPLGYRYLPLPGREEARALLVEAGASVIDEDIVRFPQWMVADAVSCAPETLLLAGRTPDRDVVLDSTRVMFTNFGEAVYLIDPDTGEVRNTTKKDVEKLTRVVDALDVIPVCERMAGAQDYPEQVAELHNYEALLMNTTKHVFTGGGNGKLTQYMIDMAKAAVGEENFEERCPVTFNTCPISPLKLTADVCEVIMTAARNGATVNVLSMGMAGGSTPVNLAGALVVHNCEALAGLVLAQTTRRGAKFIYGSSSTAMDLRYGAAVVGTPELAVLNAGVAAMARYYKLPSWAAGG